MNAAPRKADPEYMKRVADYLDQGLSVEAARKRAARELHEIRHGQDALVAWIKGPPIERPQ